jgi:hypothetical protein
MVEEITWRDAARDSEAQDDRRTGIRQALAREDGSHDGKAARVPHPCPDAGRAAIQPNTLDYLRESIEKEQGAEMSRDDAIAVFKIVAVIAIIAIACMTVSVLFHG